MLKRSFLVPAFSPYQMTRNPDDGSFLVTVNTPSLSEDMFLFDSDFEFLNTIQSPVEPPILVAAVAIRSTPLGAEIWSIGWEVRAPWMQPQEFLLSIQDMSGAFIQLPTVIDIPGPPIGQALTYPCAMVHDPETDTFWFLERNTDTFLNMDLDGQIIGSFPHPQPPFQNFVFNLGAAFDPDRNSFTVTTSGPLDFKITQAVGMTDSGLLTGEVIPLDDTDINPLYGIARESGRLWVSGSKGSIAQILELKAASDIAHPFDIDCTETGPNEITVTWTEPIVYDEVLVRRNGVIVGTVPGASGEFVDTGAGIGFKVYTVAGIVGPDESEQTVCDLFIGGGSPTFVRGDVNGDGTFNGLVDIIYLLNFQFVSGSPEPPCMDAADADDGGSVNGLVDGLYLLNFQFLQGDPPPFPYPDPGPDPTPDPLGC